MYKKYTIHRQYIIYSNYFKCINVLYTVKFNQLINKYTGLTLLIVFMNNT